MAHHDAELFQPGLNTARVHKSSSDPELVEGGQLVAMHVDPRIGQEKEKQ